MEKDSKKLAQLPEQPGVYFFLGPRKEILYIGKATSLRSRVGSYFANDITAKRSPLIAKMVHEAKSIDYTVTDSTLEALILETNLIRTHRPIYNTKAKDDKSYNHLVITKEEWPRVLVVRGKDLTSQYREDELQYVFGPFTSSQLFREALKIVQRIFQYYDTKHPVGHETNNVVRGRIDFNRQIGLYPTENNKAEYLRTIRYVRLFFEGKKKQVLKELERDMLRAARREDFEEAAHLKRKLYALQHIQDVALIRDDVRQYRDDRTVRIEAYDIAHLQGADMVGVMVVVEGEEPKKSEYRKFKISTVDRSNDTAALQEVLERRLKHDEWPLPQIVVVDGSVAQKNIAEKVLKRYSLSVPVVAVVKNDRHKPERLIASTKIKQDFENQILLANAESHRFAIAYHREKRRKKTKQRL